ncbi:MAG: hypothetical protein SVU32_09285, partial [Candidatus Nanohaloarchaea archaeon]|nr:hypothetical protein [Candidatus Nanohaloarchaea archaeon]
ANRVGTNALYDGDGGGQIEVQDNLGMNGNDIAGMGGARIKTSGAGEIWLGSRGGNLETGSQSDDYWRVYDNRNNQDLMRWNTGGPVEVRNANLQMNGNRINYEGGDAENRGNYWWGQLSLDGGGWRTSEGNSGSMSIPGSGSTTCSSGDWVCVHNHGNGQFTVEFEVYNRADDDWWSGDGTPGAMCWATSNGDNEANDEGF